MNTQEFIKRIQNTYLLDENEKARYLGRAESYTPEKRLRLIQIIEKHENNLKQKAESNKANARQKQQELIRKIKEEAEILHQREIEEAERQLEEDLKNLK